MKNLEMAFTQKDSNNQVGFYLYDLDTGETLESRNCSLPFIPASTSKILACLFALKVLGPDFKYETILGYSGKIKGGLLEGDLYLKGTGDPMFSASHLMNMVEALAGQGIRQILGRFYYDESEFQKIHCIQKGREPWAPYNCGISALSLDFNQKRVKWKETTRFHFIPEFGVSKLQRLAHLLPKETSVIFSGDDNQEVWHLSAGEPSSGERRLPIKDPGRNVAELFSKLCNLYKITVPSPQQRVMPSEAKLLYTHRSIPLIELADKALEFSNNMMTELLQIKAAAHLVKRSVSLEESAEIMCNWIKKEIPKTDWTGLEFYNGSGLNSQNRITPGQLVEVLRYADQSRFEGRSFLSLLPISGWKGTLTQRMTEPDTAFRIWAKPGAMNFVYTMGGYLFDSKGHRKVFSIMVNNLAKRAKVDSVTDPLTDEISAEAQSWCSSAIELIDQMVCRWALE